MRTIGLPPRVLSFDIFGTVVDWRRGLLAALASHGAATDESIFDRLIDAQAEDEGREYRSYREVTARSLEAVAGLPRAAADEIAAGLGGWPLHADSAEAMRRLSARRFELVARGERGVL